MRRDWSHVKGLTTVVRVLPPDLYDKVMNGDPSRSSRARASSGRSRPAENGLKQRSL